MIEKDERPDHLPLAMRQRAPHCKSIAEIAGARHDDEVERVAGLGIAEHGIVGGLPTHGGLLEILCDYNSNCGMDYGRWPLHVIASEAKQSMALLAGKWIASAFTR
jgi:hypothetical protein